MGNSVSPVGGTGGSWTSFVLFVLIPAFSSENSTTMEVTSPFSPFADDKFHSGGRAAVRYPCQCAEGECGCCSGNILSTFDINLRNRACVNVTYYPDDFEFHVKMVFNDVVFFQRRMSGKNPRPICVTLPYVNVVKMCVVFSNVYVIGRNLHMCVSIDGKFRENTVYSFSFDCIRVGASGIALLSPEEGGGLGPPKPVTDNSTDTEDYDAIVAGEGDDIQSAKLANSTNILSN